jgi:uncharacterized protein
MLLDTEFIVRAPADRVWAELLDIDALAACLPGSALSRVNGGGTLQGELRTQIAGSPHALLATLKPVDVDEDGRSASCSLRVRQSDGPAFAAGLLRARVNDSEGGARVSLAVDGRLAATQLDEESARGEAERLLSELASNLERSLGERASRPAPAAPKPSVAPARPPVAAPPPPDREAAVPGSPSLPVPAPVAAGAGLGLIALILALLFGRRSRRRGLWFEIRYRW